MPRGIPDQKSGAGALPASRDQFDVESLIAMGIPIKAAIFHDTIRFGVQGVPEFALYDPSEGSKASRTAKMWYTPAGLLCQQGKNQKLIPLANVKDTDLA